jgi:hypothetical protein
MRKTFDEMAADERAAHIERLAKDLVELADGVGVTLRISLKPLQPLAMGNTMHVIEAWPSRHGPKDF